ncbi:HAMP domain-containing histidine kinase [Chitinibacter sp. SCUT-21]|uniref:HAMP domain-containing sensor histidine kinase n=1 Tax=Chitinibacter sp. SCUT-21 TaxID=2970891 RepID=UPI0035A5E368
MQRMSLRRRISFAFSLLICSALIALAFAILTATQEQEEELIDEIVNATLNQIQTRWPIQGELLLPKNLYFYHAPLGQVAAKLPAEINQFGLGNTEYYEQGREYHVGVREYRGERLYVLYDTQDHELRLTATYIGVIWAVVLLSILALLVGYFFAGSILRQFNALTAAVEFDLPIDVSQVRDRELGVLAQAISESREQKAQLLLREREFTAHVGHELRTPLTRIRTSAELIRELGALSKSDQERAMQIEAAADEMEQRLSALLFLARDLRSINLAQINLRQALETSLQQVAEQKPQIQRLLNVDAAVWILADPQLLKMLIDNLLSNALRYTQAGQIRLDWLQGQLILSDTGQGMAEQDLHRVTLPFERASSLPDGSGLGLAIVMRICDALGWQLQIQSRLEHGTKISIQMLKV